MIIVKIIGKFLFWLITILYLELVFAWLMFHNFVGTTFINILIYSIIIASFLSIITGILKEKNNRRMHYVILFVIGFLYSLQFVFYKILKSFFSFGVLSLGNQLGDFLGETIRSILANSYGILIFMVPLIIYAIFKKFFKVSKNSLSQYITYVLLLIFSISVYIVNINLQKDTEMSIYSLYNKVEDNALNIEKTGVLAAYGLDIFRTIFGFSPSFVEVNPLINESENFKNNSLNLDLDKESSQDAVKKINEYLKKEVPTSKNQYTGLFEGYNLIYITAESFSEIGVSKELTPTLYKLINSGFKFNNFYTPNNLSTIGGEFQSMTGLFAYNSVLKKWRTGTNYFPYGLGNVLKNKGYDIHAYHNNLWTFQGRNNYFPTQGYDNFLGCGNGLEKSINCNTWPESDLEMIKETVPNYINSDKPFLTYYMTVSGHFRYTFRDNYIANKNKEYVKDLPYNENIKAYIATQIELDKALEYLINELEQAHQLDKTVIVLLADHYPYNLSMENINTLSTYERDQFVEVNHNALIIWNNKLAQKDINKVCMSIDVLPTVLNLFNIEYDSRLLVGKDIFANHEGLAFFANHSWVSDSGSYYANTNTFNLKKAVNADYIKNMNNIVNNRITYSKMVIANDYYRYLFK